MEGFKLNTDIVSRLGGRMTFLSTRNDVLTQNLANLETPEYKSRDLEFEGYLEDMQNYANTSTTQNVDPFFKTAQIENKISTADAGPNGNNVNMEDQMAQMAGNSIEYMVATEVIKKHLAMIKLSTSQG